MIRSKEYRRLSSLCAGRGEGAGRLADGHSGGAYTGIYLRRTPTGNAAPYNAPKDWAGRTVSNRLYAPSIVAVHARTGRLAWYYQTTPGDIWDFGATANLVFASLRFS